MQKLTKTITILKKISNRLLTCLILLYSILILTFYIPGTSTPPTLLTLPLYLFIPGYSFTTIILPKIHKVEKATASIGFSIALLIGIKVFIQTFRIINLFHELTVLTILSIICLTAKLITK